MIIEGHAIISQNGMIADANGEMPKFLQQEADWARFQAALDKADISVLGRKGHERHPNFKNRNRLVLTTADKSLVNEQNVTYWNEKITNFKVIVENLNLNNRIIAVTGGMSVFDVFLEIGYSRFILSIVEGKIIENGVPCFSKGHPFEVLSQQGFYIKERQIIDAKQCVISYVFEKH
jgi:dihydrofolate reductase